MFSENGYLIRQATTRSGNNAIKELNLRKIRHPLLQNQAKSELNRAMTIAQSLGCLLAKRKSRALDQNSGKSIMTVGESIVMIWSGGRGGNCFLNSFVVFSTITRVDSSAACRFRKTSLSDFKPGKWLDCMCPACEKSRCVIKLWNFEISSRFCNCLFQQQHPLGLFQIAGDQLVNVDSGRNEFTVFISPVPFHNVLSWEFLFIYQYAHQFTQ